MSKQFTPGTQPQTVCGGRWHGQRIVRARKDKVCDGCGLLIRSGGQYISVRTRDMPKTICGYWYYAYCGHCDASTPEGRQSVAAVATAREKAHA